MYNSGNSSKNVTGSAIVDGTVEAADLATAVNNDIAAGVAGKATADLALPKAGGTMTGDITVSKSVTPVHELHSLKDGVGDAEVIGSFQVYGSDGSSGGAGLRTKINTVSANSVGNSYALSFLIAPNNASAPVEKVRFPSSGGITFNGDTAAANALDDYETGTIDISTMSFLTSGSLTTNTNYQLLSYTKIGNLVTVIGNIYVNTVTAQSGALKIPLPFTNGTGQEHRTAGIIKHYQEQTAETFVRIDPNTAYGLVLKAPSWGASTIANGDTLIVNLTYTV